MCTERISAIVGDALTGVTESTYVCNRCGDWYHNFSKEIEGTCAQCFTEIYKVSAIHHAVTDEEGNMDWGYFTCKRCN